LTIQNLLKNKARKFVLVGGKGGVGKSSISSSIAVKFAEKGQPTLIISTDPAHSLSDSFDQNLNQGTPVKINNIDNLWGMEIKPEDAGGDFKSLAGLDDDEKVADEMMSSLSSLGFDAHF